MTAREASRIIRQLLNWLKEIKKALVSLTELGGNAASLFTNDNAIPYAGHEYGKVFLNTHNTLSFWELNEKESVLVEILKANNEQNYILILNQKELEKARALLRKIRF